MCGQQEAEIPKENGREVAFPVPPVVFIHLGVVKVRKADENKTTKCSRRSSCCDYKLTTLLRKRTTFKASEKRENIWTNESPL